MSRKSIGNFSSITNGNPTKNPWYQRSNPQKPKSFTLKTYPSHNFPETMIAYVDPAQLSTFLFSTFRNKKPRTFRGYTPQIGALKTADESTVIAGYLIISRVRERFNNRISNIRNFALARIRASAHLRNDIHRWIKCFEVFNVIVFELREVYSIRTDLLIRFWSL